MIDGITKLVGLENGPKLAVFGGIHGDERAGVMAIEQLSEQLVINRGVLYLVLANPPAINEGVRYQSKNLNRCFIMENPEESYEDNRANILMGILDECDALLDLHAFKSEQGEAFVICEEDSFDAAGIFDVDVVSSGWTQAEPGATDGYMHKQGKVGICMECGPIKQAKEYKEFALNSVLQFLKYYGLIDSGVKLSESSKQYINVKYAHTRRSQNFKMDQNLEHLQILDEGQVIAVDGDEVFKAKNGEYIIFPDPTANIGDEAFIIGEEIKSVA